MKKSIFLLWLYILIFCMISVIIINPSIILPSGKIILSLGTHKILEAIITFAYLLIFVKTTIYSFKYRDVRMMILAPCFIFGILLNINHLISAKAFPYDYLSFENLSINPNLFYLLVKKLQLSFSLFLTIFFCSKQITQKTKYIQLKFYLIYFLIFTGGTLFFELIYLLLNQFHLTKFYIYQNSLLIVQICTLIFTALIYADTYIKEKKVFNKTLIFGLLTIAIGQMNYLNFTLLPVNEIVAHLTRFVGYMLIFYGIDGLIGFPETNNLRKKIFGVLSCFTVLSYLVFVTSTEIIYNIQLPIFSRIIFLVFAITISIILYYTFGKLLKYLDLIVKTMSEYKPGKKPNYIEIETNDEISLIAKKYNEIIESEWQYNQRLLKSNEKIIDLLRKERSVFAINDAIIGSLNLRNILIKVCAEVLTLFNAEKVAIAKYYHDGTNGDYEWKLYIEANKDESIKKLKIEHFDIKTRRYLENHFKNHDILVVNNIFDFDENSEFKECHINNEMKSILATKIYKGNEIWGIMGVFGIKEPRTWTQKEKELIEEVSKQIYLAIRQSHLINKIQEQSKRERLLSSIIMTIRSSLDIKEIKHNVVNEMGKFFKADRCYFRSFDKTKELFLAPDVEYLGNGEAESLLNKPVNQEGIRYFFEELKRRGKGTHPLIVNEDFVKNTPIETYFKETGIIADYAIPLWDRENELTYLVLHYTKQDPKFDSKTIKLLETIANQVIMAFDQSILFEKEKETAEKERTLREIITSIREHYDLEIIKSVFVNKVGNIMNADRVTFFEFPEESDEFRTLNSNSEYRSSSDVKSMEGLNLNEYEYFKNAYDKGIEIVTQNSDEFIKNNKLEGTKTEEYYTKYDVKSGFGIPIIYHEKILGRLVIHYTKNYTKVTEDDLKFCRSIASQAAIAIHQSSLFDQLKNKFESQKIISEIITSLKSAKTAEEVINYTLKKISTIFNTDKVIFAEVQKYKTIAPFVKYEYLKSSNDTSLLNVKLPSGCIKLYTAMFLQQKIIAINDVVSLNIDNKHELEFFEKYNISACMATSLFDKIEDYGTSGIIFAISNKTRIWKKYELELFETISDTIKSILKDIKNYNEIENLRNTFIITLAHDLQVPLIGENKALEFILSKNDNESLKNIKPLVEEIKLNNENLYSILSRFIDSYKYESGNYMLNLKKENITSLLKEIISNLETLAKNKEINIKFDLEEKIPEIKIDRNEMYKAIFNIIENSIIYTQESGHININCQLNLNQIVICIKDDGPGIIKEIQAKLFKRYEFAENVERRIGGGLGLYLTKQIIEAHGGQIWYNTDLRKGTTFCISIPY